MSKKSSATTASSRLVVASSSVFTLSAAIKYFISEYSAASGNECQYLLQASCDNVIDPEQPCAICRFLRLDWSSSVSCVRSPVKSQPPVVGFSFHTLTSSTLPLPITTTSTVVTTTAASRAMTTRTKTILRVLRNFNGDESEAFSQRLLLIVEAPVKLKHSWNSVREVTSTTSCFSLCI